MQRYKDDLDSFFKLKDNSNSNKELNLLAGLAKIDKRVSFHTCLLYTSFNKYDINANSRRGELGFNAGITVGFNIFDGNQMCIRDRQKIHDKYIKQIDDMLAEKDKEIMTV